MLFSPPNNPGHPMDMGSPSPVESLTRACQVVVGRSLDWYEPPAQEEILDVFGQVPQATVYGEQLLMEQVIGRFAERLAHDVHRRFHQRFFGECTFLSTSVSVQRDAEGRLLVPATVAAWIDAYGEAFANSHNSPAQRARRLLEAADGKGLDASHLARSVCAGRRTLERQFLREIGESIASYRTRVRLRAALRRLSEGDECVESIALLCGWKSKKALYAALKSVTNLMPADLRRLCPDQLEAIRRRLALRRYEQP